MTKSSLRQVPTNTPPKQSSEANQINQKSNKNAESCSNLTQRGPTQPKLSQKIASLPDKSVHFTISPIRSSLIIQGISTCAILFLIFAGFFIFQTKTAPELDSLTVGDFVILSELYSLNEEEVTDNMHDITYPPPEQTYYRREYIRSMINHAWDGYYQNCPGFDELKPQSGTCYNWLKNGATAIDSSSLFLMLNDTRRYTESISITTHLNTTLTEHEQIKIFQTHFPQAYLAQSQRESKLNSQKNEISKSDRKVSYFETTIRVLAGFLSQYEFSKDATYLRKAIETADALMPSFDQSPSGLPMGSINLKTGKAETLGWCGGCYVLADVGTSVIEFCLLSRALFEYQQDLSAQFGIPSPYNLKNSVQDPINPTQRLYTNSQGEQVSYIPLQSMYSPFEYCQRAHHVTSILHAAAYTQKASQHSGLFPQYLFSSHINSDPPPAISPKLDTSTTISQSDQQYQNNLSNTLGKWYQQRRTHLEKKKLTQTDFQSPDPGYYSSIYSSTQIQYPFSPTMLLQSIHSYSNTNNTVPGHYSSIAQDWVTLLTIHPSQLYHNPITNLVDTVLPSQRPELLNNQGRTEKDVEISKIQFHRQDITKKNPLTAQIEQIEQNNPNLQTSTLIKNLFMYQFDTLYNPKRISANKARRSTTTKAWKSMPISLPQDSIVNQLPSTPIPTSIATLYNKKQQLLQFQPHFGYSVGPMSDSVYEYFLKFWIATGKKNPMYLDLYLKAVKGAFHLLYHEYTPDADLQNYNFSRKINRLYEKNSNVILNDKLYITKLPIELTASFHRPDGINLLSKEQKKNATIYSSSSYLNKRTQEWIYHDSLRHDTPRVDALINPKIFNRVMKWLTSQTYGTVVSGSQFSDMSFAYPFSTKGRGSNMNHLSCFFPGVLALGLMHDAVPLENQAEHLEKAENLARGCVRGYLLNPYTGLAPEEYTILPNGTFQLSSPTMNYNLRPETVESLYLLWRYTGKQIYRELVWLIVSNIEKYCRAKYGFSNIADVFKHGTQSDRQETFLLAEVMRYAYLTFEEGEKEPIDPLHKIKVPKDLNFDAFQPAKNGNNRAQSERNPYSSFFNPQQVKSKLNINRASETGYFDFLHRTKGIKSPSASSLSNDSTLSQDANINFISPFFDPTHNKTTTNSSQNSHELWDLNKFVFNTEAHVLPIREFDIDKMLLDSISIENIEHNIRRHTL